MGKRYQVFISSTYQDLQDERQKVIEALLGKNCFPIGMEFFPAANDDQLTVIKKLIDKCDYYILIIGGRYGSVEPISRKSYTHLEFEYAVSKGIPVASFYHAEPNRLMAEKVESTDEGKRKLEDFKKIVQKRLCNSWKESFELAYKLNQSLDYLFENSPRTGWVRADGISSAAANKEILDLRNENASLKAKINVIEAKSPEDIESLEHGDDTFTFHTTSSFFFDPNKDRRDRTIEETWNRIFLDISNTLLSPKSMADINYVLTSKINARHRQGSFDVKITDDDVQTILIQLMALGLIDSGLLKSDGLYTYWELTPYGKKEMTRLLVRKRKAK